MGLFELIKMGANPEYDHFVADDGLEDLDYLSSVWASARLREALR